MSAKQFPKGPTVTLVRTIRPKGLPSVYCNNSCCIYSRECVVTSFYSSIVRLVGSYYLSDRSPKLPPSLIPTVVASFAYADILNRCKNLWRKYSRRDCRGGRRPRYSVVHLLMSYTAPFVKNNRVQFVSSGSGTS